MATVVTYDDRPDVPPLNMSNGLTSVFIATLSLASSAIATSDRQREFAVWFATHDQATYGLGVVDFDVSELPWRVATFETDRAFVLDVIEAATARTGWGRLGYSPREDWIFPALSQFRCLVELFDAGHIRPDLATNWVFGEPPDSFELCQTHSVYLHSGGCVVCNDH